MKNKKLEAKRIAEFMRLLHAFQSVERVAYAPDLERKENDVEHSYMLTMLCWYLIDAMKLDLDKNTVLRYGLVHDFVEVYAGDTYVFDPEALQSKHEREEQSRLRVQKEFPEFNDLHSTIIEYEKQSDPEAIFVREVDKLIPFIINNIQGGFAWKKHKVTADEAFALKRKTITKTIEVRELLEQFIAEVEPRIQELFYSK